MARIRSIKPEFPHSESMGRVSRDARLTFIQLWTLSDDAGRLRGNSRMLASLLFPYDDDAPKLIDKWLGELERECCIVRYTADGASYVEVCNWLSHQKIDKPSASKLPCPDEGSRSIANTREESSEDQGSEDQGREGKGEDQIPAATPPDVPRGRRQRFTTEDPVCRVFDHWRTTYRHTKAVLDAKRRKLIARALTEYSETDLIASISGYQNSPHHMGQNDTGTVFDDIGLFLRDATHVDAGLRCARGPPVKRETAMQRINRVNGGHDERRDDGRTFEHEPEGDSQGAVATTRGDIRGRGS